MKIRGMWQVVVMVGVLGIGCSKAPATAPKTVVPPAVASADFQYSVGAFGADSGYTVKSLEYADANGVVRKVDYQAPLWEQMVSLKPGDRMYVRAEVQFASTIAGGIQIVSPPAFYTSAMVERADGPATSVLVIDRIVK